MRAAATLFLALAAAAATPGLAATAYVTDELVLGLYAHPDTQGERLATLHSGATLEALEVDGDATHVMLADGRSGWVKTLYLTPNPPATLRVRQLEDEADQRRATTPGLAEAAERSEVLRLTRELAGKTLRIADPTPPWGGALGMAAALGCGFWLGHARLARRLRAKFGGVKVY